MGAGAGPEWVGPRPERAGVGARPMEAEAKLLRAGPERAGVGTEGVRPEREVEGAVVGAKARGNAAARAGAGPDAVGGAETCRAEPSGNSKEAA